MLLCVPLVGSDQTVYGVCGVEVSALYFQLSCPAVTGQFGSAVTVLAPIQDNRLVLGQGLVGGVSGTYLEGQETFSIHQGRYFNTYLSESGQYIGLQTPIPISKEDTQGLQWAVAILLPQESYAAYNANVRQTWIIAALPSGIGLVSPSNSKDLGYEKVYIRSENSNDAHSAGSRFGRWTHRRT